jgi:hypothetical protein
MHSLPTIHYDPERGQYLVMAPDGTVLTRCNTFHDADTAVAQFAFLATFLPHPRIAS